MNGKELLFATTNLGKFREAQDVALQYAVELCGFDQVNRELKSEPPKICETGRSYEENALLKARACAAWSGIPTIADDSGIELAELGGLPGVFTSRFGVKRVISSLGKERCYQAVMVCCVAYVEPRGRTVTVSKRLPGYLTVGVDSRGPLDPLPFSKLFTPVGSVQSLAELLAAGGFLSHRGQALAGLFAALSLSEVYSD